MIKFKETLIQHLKEEIQKQCDVVVLGLSGGADSTLVACLCVEALGAENVYGVHMPYGETDKKVFNKRSLALSDALGIPSRVIPIFGITNEIVSSVEQNMMRGMTDLNKGNARSRARMCVLYALAGHLGGNTLPGKRVRVVGTGNMSEDYIGYDTKGGDALADFFPIGDLFKSEVYQLLDHYKEHGVLTEELIDRHPSAGLWEGQTDEGELGYTYNEMEPAIRWLLANKWDSETLFKCPITDFVAKRHLANRHKHQAPPNIPLRALIDEEV